MRKSLVWIALFALVGCKGKEEASAESAGTPAPADSAAAVASAFAEAAAALARAQAAASAGSVAAPSVPAPSASAAETAPSDSGFTAAVANELGRLGFSTAAKDLVSLGKDRASLLNGLGRLAGHATALSAVFNDDRVVSAFTKRADMQEACRDPEKLKPLLLYVLDSSAARAWVNDPASIKAFTSSKLGTQLRACSAFKSLVQQPKLLATLTKDHPSATAVVGNPNFRAELDRLKIRQDPAGSRFSRK